MFDINTLTREQKTAYRTLIALQEILKNANVDTAEVAQYTDMISKKKKELVYSIYFTGKKRKEFYKCKDGRVKSYNPQFIAPNEEVLLEKLYSYYFEHTLQDVFSKWVQYRLETKIVANKTIQEDISIWNRFISDTEIAKMQIAAIKPRHILKLFHLWTGSGLITRKDFCNRKAVLNGIWGYALTCEMVDANIISVSA